MLKLLKPERDTLMGLTNFNPDESEPVSDRKKRSSGGGGSTRSDGYRKLPAKHVPPGKSDEDYPFYCLKSPNYALVEDGDGYDWLSWPATPEVRYEKESPNDIWEMVDEDKYALMYWDELAFSRVKKVVDSELGGNLVDMLHNSPEMALEAVELAERMNKGNSPAYESVSCECCGREYHYDYGDYHKVSGHYLCGSHTVEELKEREIL